MSNEFDARLSIIDEAVLTPLVQDALETQTLDIIDWTCDPIKGGFADRTVGGAGTYRFSGQAKIQDEIVLWAFILKVLGKSSDFGSDDPTDWNYWKREILAYQSGLLSNLPGGLSVPRCFGVKEHPGNQFWIWLEEIPETSEADNWSMARYELAARHLGQFNGAYLMGHPMPNHSWLTEGRVRNWLKIGEPQLRDLPGLTDHLVVRRWFTGNSLERTMNLWSKREQLLQQLDRLPRSLCHHDAFRRNLLTKPGLNGGEQTVGIDWQIVGTGAIGEEIAPLVAVSLQFFEVDMEQAATLEATVFEGYVAGLRDTGWSGDTRLARFGFGASAALFVGVGGAGLWLSGMLIDDNAAAMEKVLGQPLDVILERFAALQRYLLDLGDEALALAEVLGSTENLSKTSSYV